VPTRGRISVNPIHDILSQLPLFPIVEKGPALGEAMRAAEAAWIKAGFPDESAALNVIAD